MYEWVNVSVKHLTGLDKALKVQSIYHFYHCWGLNPAMMKSKWEKKQVSQYFKFLCVFVSPELQWLMLRNELCSNNTEPQNITQLISHLLLRWYLLEASLSNIDFSSPMFSSILFPSSAEIFVDALQSLSILIFSDRAEIGTAFFNLSCCGY